MSEIIRYAIGESSLGPFIAAASAQGLVAFEFADRPAVAREALQQRFPDAVTEEDVAGMAATIAGLLEVVDRPERRSDLTLDPRGSAFEQRVWAALRGIPAGRTMSYGAVANSLGRSGDAREVAEACAGNMIAILIPCHRVVKSDGSISGYRWGVRRKRLLLAREQSAVPFEFA